MAQQISTNTFGCAKWIVSSDATQGTHTTIGAAITSASSGDTIFIRPGTYTENLTTKNGLTFTALSPYGGAGYVTKILGKIIDNGVALSNSFNNIAFATNGDNFLNFTASGSTVTLNNCSFRCTNATGMNCSTGVTVQCNYCNGDLTTTGIGYFTGAAAFLFDECNFTNSGTSTTASTSSGTVNILSSSFSSPISNSGSGGTTVRNSIIDCGALNATALTTAGSGSSATNSSIFFSGTASAISIGTGTNLTASNITVSSSNTNAITGAGTLINGGISFIGTSSLINTTTQTARNFDVGGLSFDGGTNTMAAYIVSTFTPAINFGGGSTGITYSTQSGNYILIGKLLMLNLNITLTNKGSSTGTATVVGFPSYLPAFNSYAVIRYTNLSNITGGTAVAVVRNNAGTMDALIQFITNNASPVNLSDTAFSNSTGISITAFVQVN